MLLTAIVIVIVLAGLRLADSLVMERFNGLDAIAYSVVIAGVGFPILEYFAQILWC